MILNCRKTYIRKPSTSYNMIDPFRESSTAIRLTHSWPVAVAAPIPFSYFPTTLYSSTSHICSAPNLFYYWARLLAPILGEIHDPPMFPDRYVSPRAESIWIQRGGQAILSPFRSKTYVFYVI